MKAYGLRSCRTPPLVPMIIFFDIDGTLMNQRQAEATAAARFIRDHAHRLSQPADVDAFCQHWRIARERHAPAYFRGAISYDEYHRRRIREMFLDGATLTDAQCDARHAAFLEEYRAAWTLFDDVRPCLDALAGFRLGILSNGNAAGQRMKLQRMGILDRFSTVIISEEVGCAKPHHGIFQEACRRARLREDRCLHLGDRLNADARAGCAAGIRGIWLDRNRGETPRDVEAISSLIDLPPRLHRSAAPHLYAAPAN